MFTNIFQLVCRITQAGLISMKFNTTPPHPDSVKDGTTPLQLERGKVEQCSTQSEVLFKEKSKAANYLQKRYQICCNSVLKYTTCGGVYFPKRAEKFLWCSLKNNLYTNTSLKKN